MSPSRRALLCALPAALASACDRGRVDAAPVSDVPTLRQAAPFPVGTCVMTPELADPAFVALAARQFSQVTPEWELKMERVLAEDGTFRFEAADAIAGFCRTYSLALHATTLVWYAQDPPAFRPLVGDRARFRQGLANYISAAVGRYRGLARGWDVLNEAVAEDGHGYRGGVWARELGPDYDRLAFDLARAADPHAVLFLNDYNLETIPAKLDGFQRLVERLLRAGAPLGGLGTQSHLKTDLPRGAAARTIAALGRFGLPVHVSELDISTRVSPLASLTGERGLSAQARIAEETAGAFMDLPPHQRYAFTLWGVRDQDSWLRRAPNAGDGSDRPLLFNDDGTPKPAFAAVRRTLQRRP